MGFFLCYNYFMVFKYKLVLLMALEMFFVYVLMVSFLSFYSIFFYFFIIFMVLMVLDSVVSLSLLLSVIRSSSSVGSFYFIS